ncbi:MAG: hypothetical protein ACRCSZ_10995 [Lactococcus lactis]
MSEDYTKEAKRLVRCGEYRFYITKFIDSKDGKEMVTKKGNRYVQLILTAFSESTGEGCDLFHLVFGRDDVKNIFDSVGATYRDGNNLSFEDLKSLIGKGGNCIIGIDEARGSYGASNSVKCLIKKEGESILTGAKVSVQKNETSSQDDGLPF